MKYKRCSKCKRYLVRSSKYFIKNKSKPYGLDGWCKLCSTRYNKTPKRQEDNRLRMQTSSRFSYAKSKAKSKGHKWRITRSKYYKLISCKCFYCNQVLDKYGIGLDRINNKKGYTLQNVVPCCGYCNWCKREKSQKEFLLWIHKVSNHTKEL